MTNITITCTIDEDFLEMETSNSTPTKQALEEILFRQFPCLENIVVNQERL